MVFSWKNNLSDHREFSINRNNQFINFKSYSSELYHILLLNICFMFLFLFDHKINQENVKLILS